MNLRGDHCQCVACREYFNSTAAFDKHRVGKFDTNRRCLTVEEMRGKGMDKSARGFWVTQLKGEAWNTSKSA